MPRRRAPGWYNGHSAFEGARALHAFTLIELMISVAIIGILAAAAIPALTKYVKKARTTEARIFVKKIADGSVSYYLDSTNRAGSMVQLVAQFPLDLVSYYADPNCCAKGGPNEVCLPIQSLWDIPTWKALQFSVDDPHRYAYNYVSNPTAFLAQARGDLDCDGQFSNFGLVGVIDEQYSDGVTVGPLERSDELE